MALNGRDEGNSKVTPRRYIKCFTCNRTVRGSYALRRHFDQFPDHK